MNYIISAALFLFLISPPSTAVNKEADAEAVRGLSILKHLITADNFQNYGLMTFSEVSQLQLGKGVDVYYVFSDDLKDYGQKSKPGGIIKSADTRVYPVTVNGEGRLLITIRLRNGVWKTAKFGRPDVAAALARRGAIESSMKLGSSYELEVPAMHLSFAAVGRPSEDKAILLMPLDHYTMMTLHPDLKEIPPFAATSSIISADEAFKTLSESAKKLSSLGSPPQ